MDKLIFDSFSGFILDKKLIEPADLEYLIDDTVNAYILNAIKQVFDDYENHKCWLDDAAAALAENFDLESFLEVIDAYVPGFSSQLNANTIMTWLIKLKKEIDENEKQRSRTHNYRSLVQASSSDQEATSSQTERNLEIVVQIEDENLKTLADMFPELEFKEVEKVYKKCGLNYEKAIDELLMNEKVIVVDDDNLTEKERKELKEKTLKRFDFFVLKFKENIKKNSAFV